MPARNKNQYLGSGSASGSASGSQSTPSGQLLPDILRFKNIPSIARTRTLWVEAVWNMAVIGFDKADVEVHWDDIGQVPRTAWTGGRDVDVFFQGGRHAPIRIRFPFGKNGEVTINIRPNAVFSEANPNLYGPPFFRGFTLKYKMSSAGDVLISRTPTPATLILSVPSIQGTGTWKQTTYLQLFRWSRSVTNFTEADIDIGEGAGRGTVRAGKLTRREENNRVYQMPITFTSSGTYQIAVRANAANAGGSNVANSPPEPVAESWAFNITGNRKLKTPPGAKELLYEERALDDELDERIDAKHGGSFLGVSDMTVFEGRLYFVSQIQRTGRYGLSTAHPSAASLISIPRKGNAPKTIHKKYRLFTAAARSLVVHEKELYFFQGSSYLYPTPHHAIDEQEIGVVYRMKEGTNARPVSIGLNWRGDLPTGPKDALYGIHAATLSPMRTYDGQLHLISMRYELLQQHGILWIVWGKKENRRLTLLKTNERTGWEIFEELAMLTNSYVGVENGIFVYKPRTPRQARLYAAVDNDDTLIRVDAIRRQDNWKKSDGNVIINSELIHYTQMEIAGEVGTLTGVTRGMGNTAPSTAHRGDKVILIQHVIDATQLIRPVNEMDIETDETQRYNSVLAKYAENQVPRTDYLEVNAEDEESQNKYGKRPITITLPLDFYHSRWAEQIANAHLQHMKQLHFIVNLTLKTSFEFDIGDVVFLTEPILSKTQFVGQIIEIIQLPAQEETEIRVMRLIP